MTDLFIIGGGPSGLAAGIAAARAGLRVELHDARIPPVDKTCGEGLMPDTIAAALDLGIELPRRRYPFRGVRFRGGTVSVQADFPPRMSPAPPACGVRRTDLHQCLVEQAETGGVRLCWGSSVQGLEGLKARWILGADGSSSRVRKWAGLERSVLHHRRYGYRVHFARAPWTDYLEIYWGQGFQLYITPVADGEVSVALISRDPRLRVREAIRRVPELESRLAGVPESSRESGAATASRKLWTVARHNVALIGDASGSVDAITGEGLGLAFRQARALPAALLSGDLRPYARAHRRLEIRPHLMAQFMLTIDRWNWLRNRALPSMSRQPDIFGGLLAMHVGESSWARFGYDCVRLGWVMLRN